MWRNEDTWTFIFLRNYSSPWLLCSLLTKDTNTYWYYSKFPVDWGWFTVLALLSFSFFFFSHPKSHLRIDFLWVLLAVFNCIAFLDYDKIRIQLGNGTCRSDLSSPPARPSTCMLLMNHCLVFMDAHIPVLCKHRLCPRNPRAKSPTWSVTFIFP